MEIVSLSSRPNSGQLSRAMLGPDFPVMLAKAVLRTMEQLDSSSDPLFFPFLPSTGINPQGTLYQTSCTLNSMLKLALGEGQPVTNG